MEKFILSFKKGNNHPDYLTPEKEYIAYIPEGYEKEDGIYSFIDDEGCIIYVSACNSAHLYYGSFDVKEIKDETI